MRSCCSTPRTVVAGGHSATSAQAPCRSTRRSNASATIHISWNCARHSGEPPQRVDAKSEGLPWKLQPVIHLVLCRAERPRSLAAEPPVTRRADIAADRQGQTVEGVPVLRRSEQRRQLYS